MLLSLLLAHLYLRFGTELTRIKVTKLLVGGLLIISGILAQGDFNLEDLNPNSDTYGQIIGPDDYLGDICIVYFGHEY